MSLDTQKLSNLPTKDKIVTSDDLIRKAQEEAQIDKIHEEFERSELEKLESRLKNLKSCNLQSEAQANPKIESDLDNANRVSSTSVQPKIDPVEDLYKKMLDTEEKRQKNQNDDNEVRLYFIFKILIMQMVKV